MDISSWPPNSRGSIQICGETISYERMGRAIYIACFDGQGNPAWQRTFRAENVPRHADSMNDNVSLTDIALGIA